MITKKLEIKSNEKEKSIFENNIKRVIANPIAILMDKMQITSEDLFDLSKSWNEKKYYNKDFPWSLEVIKIYKESCFNLCRPKT